MDTKIRVLHYGALSETYGGVESYIINQYREMRKYNIQYDFLVNNSNEKLAYEDELKNYGCHIYRVWNGRRNGIIKHYYYLYKFFKTHKKKYDIAIGNYLDLQNIDFLIMAKLFGIKTCIAHAHAGNNLRRTKLWSFLVRLNRIILYFICNVLFSCSEDAGKWMFGNFLWNRKKKYIIINGINIEKFLFDEKKRIYFRKMFNVEGALVIGHTGRLAEEKNHEFIIDIFYELYKKKKNIYLFLIGKGILKNEIENKIKDLKLDKNIILLGERKDINELLNMMDIFLFPSKTEGLGISLIEAQVNGLKCFTSKDVVPREVKITKNIEFISLTESANYWAERILKNMEYNRNTVRKEMILSNYNINNNVHLLKNIFFKIKE